VFTEEEIPADELAELQAKAGEEEVPKTRKVKTG
jgi:hypothetical protein